jgi:hypothetical protein
MAFAVLLAVAACALACTVADAAGPWRGRTVDAVTGQPIPGVVVVASWSERTPSSSQPHDAVSDLAEAVTGGDGWFVISERVSLKRRQPSGAVIEPELTMFKSGYGAWRARQELANLEREGTVFELTPVTTREERLAALERVEIRFDPELVPLWTQAYSRERVALGLTPYPLKP